MNTALSPPFVDLFQPCCKCKRLSSKSLNHRNIEAGRGAEVCFELARYIPLAIGGNQQEVYLVLQRRQYSKTDCGNEYRAGYICPNSALQHNPTLILMQFRRGLLSKSIDLTIHQFGKANDRAKLWANSEAVSLSASERG